MFKIKSFILNYCSFSVEKKMQRFIQVIIGCFAVSISATPTFSVYDLLTEQVKNPIGIETSVPHFSWKIYAQERNFKQGAYRICVANSSTDLKNDNANIWDSGKVFSESSILNPFGGKKLTSSTVYYWKVKVWNDKGEESRWSEVNTFATGLWSEKDWGMSRWISLETDNPKVKGIHGLDTESLPISKVGMYKMPQFRKQFQTKENIQKASIYISGLGHFDLYLNGTKVGDHFLDAGWTLYDKEALYVSFDITDQLRIKDNVLGVMLGNGFYNVPQERYFKLLVSYGAPKLRLKLKIDYKDGTSQEITSDKSWKVTESPITYSSIYGGEDYDATKEEAGWLNAGFDDSTWKNALEAKNYAPKMVSQQIEPLKVKKEIPVVKCYKNHKGNIIYDLGQNFSGIVRLDVSGKRGQKVRLIPAELLNADSTVNQSASGAPFYYDYTLRGDKSGEVWQPQFTYYGFRYVEVEGGVAVGDENERNLPVITELNGLHTCLSAPETGTFVCSNPLFNKIHELIDWAMRSNMASVLTDCPHREKLGWVEQCYLMQYSLQYRYNLCRLYHKTIRDMCLSQTEQGAIPSITPEYVRFKDGFEDTPEWGSAFIISSWYIYLWYGDNRLLVEYYPMMKKYMDYLASRGENHIIAYGLGDWFDIGPNAPGYSQLTTNGLTATATYYYNATIMQKIANQLSLRNDAKKYEKLAAEIKESFNQRFFDTSIQTYDRNSQTANAIVLFMDLMDEQYKQSVVDNLVCDIKERNYALTAGDIGYRYVLQALESNHLSEIVYRMNCRYNVPGYGWQLAHGATALTESWQAYGFVSNNHFMLGHLMEWLYGSIGGIRQTEQSLAYKTTLIDPQIVGDIVSASTSYESSYGRIYCEWKKHEKDFEMRVSIPANSEAVVILPTIDIEKVMDYGTPLGLVKDVVCLETEKNRMKVKIGSGNYLFSVKDAFYAHH